MIILLRDFIESDLEMTHRFAMKIQSQKYMSRYLPHGNNYEQMCKNSFTWKIILVNNKISGIIWLEKTVAFNQALLGIMLFHSENFGKGIVKEAIMTLLSSLKISNGVEAITLNVRESNQRAISCYKQIGFKVVDSGIKVLGSAVVPFIKMQKHLIS